MKKIKFPIVWILLLAAICALTAALAKNIKWVRQEFPMDGSNVSQLRIHPDSGKFFVTERSGCTCFMKTRQHKKEKINGGMSGSIAVGQFFCKFGACHAALARI